MPSVTRNRLISSTEKICANTDLTIFDELTSRSKKPAIIPIPCTTSCNGLTALESDANRSARLTIAFANAGPSLSASCVNPR